MSKKNKKNAIVETEVKNEAVEQTTMTTDDIGTKVVAALRDGFNTALTTKQAEYIARHDTSCAAALAKAWIETGLTIAESMEFCKEWNKKYAPANVWGTTKSNIKAHVAWLKKKYLFPISMDDAGKIVIGTQFEF